MATNGKSKVLSEGLKQQRAYTGRLQAEGFDFSLVVADAFVRGIRDIGYRNTATALNELIDNSIQATAQRVHVAFGFEGAVSDAKPIALAVIDDGHGMDEMMIRASSIWGGTHRENDRAGFGRYGYGLPSACMSQGKRFTVYSWHEQSDGIHSVTLDVDELGKGKYRDKNGRMVVPPARRAELPNWIASYIEASFPGGMPPHGTVVLIEKLDKLTWKTTSKLLEKLPEQFGGVYRNYLRTVSIAVHGRSVEILDPLFLTAGARLYKGDAVGFSEAHLEVKNADKDGPLGVVKIRYAFLPPSRFALKYAKSSELAPEIIKARNSIIQDYNGLIIMRNGRQLDLVTRLPASWRHGFQNNDRFYKVEVDFPPTLDEEFSVTTSKQQVGLSDRVWDLLEKAGVRQMIGNLKGRVGKELSDLRTQADVEKKQQRASEQAMKDAAKFKTRKPSGDSANRAREAADALRRQAEKRAKELGLPVEEVERRIVTDQENNPYKVDWESMPGAPFYRVERSGGQIVLWINTAHRFYTDVYAVHEAGPYMRAALEVLLFVMGECELDATDDRRQFYEVERAEWSRGLNTGLDRLDKVDPAEDRQPDTDEAEELTVEAA